MLLCGAQVEGQEARSVDWESGTQLCYLDAAMVSPVAVPGADSVKGRHPSFQPVTVILYHRLVALNYMFPSPPTLGKQIYIHTYHLTEHTVPLE